MNSLLNDLNNIVSELRSSKPPTRHKAMENLYQKLSSSKENCITVLQQKSSSITWHDVFQSATSAIIAHAENLVESEEKKTYQVLANKTYIYSNVLEKIINYNLEAGSNLLVKSTVLRAFEESIKMRCVVKYFGVTMLNVLDRGIYLAPNYVCELKVSEYSRILSYLFELNIHGDEYLSSRVLKSITKTVQLAKERVQLHMDLVAYMPELTNFITTANNNERKIETVRLYFLFISEVSVNYHQTLCSHIQNILPKLCDFYNEDCFRDDTKTLFFQSVVKSLDAFYPKIHAGDFNTFNVSTDENWPLTILKLRTIIDMEIRNNPIRRYKTSQLRCEKFSEQFVKMSALVIYIVLWHVEPNRSCQEDDVRSSKIRRTSDKLETLFELVDIQQSTFNDIWFAILTELLQLSETILNAANFQQSLETTYAVLRMFDNARNLQNVRLCLDILLKTEKQLVQTKAMSSIFLSKIWLEIGDYVISETTPTTEIVTEKHLIIQAFIAHGKLSATQCCTLIQYITTNEMLKRNECIATIRQLFIHAEQCGIDKASAEIEPLINCFYGNLENSKATMLIHNIAAIDEELLADTFAIGIINFLDEQQLQQLMLTSCSPKSTEMESDLQPLMYKYNRELICLEQEYQNNFTLATNALGEVDLPAKNCLFQSNYELLMRVLNYEPVRQQDRETINILNDLKAFYKLSCTMERLLYYKVFDRENFKQCPIIKRVGLFLSHLEFQLKESEVSKIDEGDLRELLLRLNKALTIYTSNDRLLLYLENQPLDVLIAFTSTTLEYYKGIHKKGSEASETDSIASLCLSILGNLCASNSHRVDAFSSILKSKIKWQAKHILAVTKMLCNCKNVTDISINWLVDKLKIVFQYHYLNVEIVNEVIEYLPTVFYFVKDNEDLLDNMLIALNSLLKVAWNKSYSALITAKILRCISLIAQRCPNIFAVDNFAVICKSATKFLTFPALEIQFATLSTMTVLMNTKCVSLDPIENCELHMQFCEELYECIDWKKLTFDNEDLKQNSISVTIQTLAALFAFSSFHQEVALQNLLHFCALHKLTQADFYAFQNSVNSYKQTIQELILPYVEVLIQKWISKHYPISKFPYFVCYDTKEAFFNQNAKAIAAYTFIYGTNDELKRLKKSINAHDVVIKESIPTIMAFMLPKLSSCAESEFADFKQNHQTLTQNLEHYKINIKTPAEPNATTLCYTIKLLLDKTQMKKLFEFVNCNKKPEWYNLSSGSLFKCLSYYICNTKGNESQGTTQVKVIHKLITKHPITFVKLLVILKTNCYNTAFSMQELQCFFLYCAITQPIFDCVATNDRESQQLINFFIHDSWFFVPNLILHAHSCQLQKAGLQHMELIWHKTNWPKENFETYFDSFAKLLLSCIMHMEMPELKTQAVNILLQMTKKCCKNKLDMLSLLNEYTKQKVLEPLLQLCQKDIDSSTINDADFISSFLENCRVQRLRTLRPYIAKHKSYLQKHTHILFELINQLIKIVRCSHTNDNCLDALKCLAEIGPLKISHISYYFQNDFENYDEQLNSDKPMLQFINIVYEILNKQLFYFNPQTQEALITVAGHMVNSTEGSKLLDQHPNLQIFRLKYSKTSFLNSYTNIASLDWLAILKSTEHLKYEQWICAFMSQVFQHADWTGFKEFAACDCAFAEACLQPFVKILLSSKDQHLSSLLELLDYFFEQFCQVCTTNGNAKKTVIYQEKRAIKMFLSICECIRVVNNWTIPINLSNIIKASNHCQAYFLSIMYLELWACSSLNKLPLADAFADDSFQMSAKMAYESIGCIDAVSGFLNPLRSRIDYLNLNNNWSDILLESDSIDNANTELHLDILKRNGMMSFASLQQRHNKAIDHEICWRLGQWTEQTEGQLRINSANNLEEEYKKHHYIALKSIKNREEENSISAIANAYKCIEAILRDISVECLQSVYKYLSWLGTLLQAEDFCEIQFTPKNNINEIFEKWQTELDLEYGNFNCKEYILAHQIALFKMAGTRATRRIEQFYKENPVDIYLLKCIGECKSAGKLNLAKKYIVSLRNVPDIKASTQISVLLEDADVCSQTGNQQITKAILQHVVTNIDFKLCLQRITALRMQGEFLMDTNAESFTSILNSKFNSALKRLDDFESKKGKLMELHPQLFKWETFDTFINDNRKSSHAAIAKYADKEYQQLNNYMNSEEYQMLRNIIQKNRQMAGSVSQREDRDKRVGAMNMTRFANLDEMGLQSMEENLTAHLCTAVSNYIKYCILDETFSSATIYRILALWFSNKQNKILHAKIKELLPLVPSYKFICALNQLTARLSSKNEEFMIVLVELLLSCVQDHPHHTLYQLYPLVFASLDGGTTSNSERTTIVKKLISKASGVGTISNQLKLVFPALIEFANTENSPNSKATTLSLSEKLKRIKNLDAVQCPTIELSVSPNKQYNITSIVKWSSECSLVGGINVPKKLTCLCTDGKSRPQLLKGKDDLRQDAVMQQVFGLINELLSNESEFKERKLKLRTYKITPLSMRSGILEWCENTMPVAAYLIGDGKGGAHKKYRPNDWHNHKCRQLSMSHLKSQKEKRFEVYQILCEKVKPVFHYFLLEKFMTPGIWFEKRLAYTNSVATTSMVGFVLGLGDRHTQNILIDEKTAEVVHIDFGVTFEQGKILQTPETVPFRLTRDFVAPMGVCGTNGVFTKSCEATLHILRRYKSVITTILEVLLYDPLYQWNTVQSSCEQSSESKNLLAQRALLVVQNKLEGREAGLFGTSSVEVQVQRLINEAMLPSNLCMLYPGWDSHL